MVSWRYSGGLLFSNIRLVELSLFYYVPVFLIKKNKEKQGIRHVNKGLKKYFKQEGKAIVLNEIARKRKAS